jgi:hypothetical protein
VPAHIPPAERLLLETVRRRARQPGGWLALVLLLSRMAPPSPRPHHRRIARAMMQDAALRQEGQVFAMRNGDLVLVCRAPPWGGPEPEATGPASLPSTLARLLRVDCPASAELIAVWPLGAADQRLTDYIARRVSEAHAAPPAEEESAGQTGAIEEIAGIIDTASISDLLQRQTAVLLPPARIRPGLVHPALPAGRAASDGAAPALQAIFREVTFSIAALEGRITPGSEASGDPFLFRHLAGRLDHRMLEVLSAKLGSGEPLDIAPPEADGAILPPPLHLNLTLPGILSEGFARFAAACREKGAEVGIEVALIEACADPDRFAAARRLVEAAGMRLVLDGVSHLTLLLSRPAALRPDLIKLDWSPRLPDLPEADRDAIAADLAGFGPQRVVLQRAETEAAVRWGLGHGIRRFQGRHIDAMLAASRILCCPLAPRCTLRQCIERARATGTAGRASCGNKALLDAGAPSEGDVASSRKPAMALT